MTNLIEILKKYNVPFRQHGEDTHATHGWISVSCPWCDFSNKFHLGINIQRGSSNCWKCGTKNTVEVISKICKISYGEANKLWSSIPKQATHEKPVHTGELQKPNQIYTMCQAHRKYLQERGFDPDIIERLWGVKGIGLGSYLKWRLFIPIHDKYGEMVSWTTRSINPNSEKRYISAKSDQEAIPHKDILYGAHLARQTIIIVEGPIDAWAMGPGAVATFGLSLSQSQIREISQYPTRIFCFDSAKSAQKQAKKLCNWMSVFPGNTVNIVLESGSDPADADPEEIQEIRKTFLQEFN